MSTRAQQAQLITNATFQQQVIGSLIYTATQVINEAATTANHIHRLAWANAILANPQQQMLFFIPAVLTNATISAAAGAVSMTASGTPCNDSDIDYVVASLYNTYADQYVSQINVGAPLLMGH